MLYLGWMLFRKRSLLLGFWQTWILCSRDPFWIPIAQDISGNLATFVLVVLRWSFHIHIVTWKSRNVCWMLKEKNETHTKPYTIMIPAKSTQTHPNLQNAHQSMKSVNRINSAPSYSCPSFSSWVSAPFSAGSHCFNMKSLACLKPSDPSGGILSYIVLAQRWTSRETPGPTLKHTRNRPNMKQHRFATKKNMPKQTRSGRTEHSTH